MPSVESFELDHNAVKAPYVRHCGVHKVGTDGVVNKYDIRFCQPNKQAMKPDAIHTLEHLLAFNIRTHSEKYDHFDIIDISPMGCQTGYYLVVSGEPTVDEIVDLMEDTLKDAVEIVEIPAAQFDALKAQAIPLWDTWTKNAGATGQEALEAARKSLA